MQHSCPPPPLAIGSTVRNPASIERFLTSSHGGVGVHACSYHDRLIEFSGKHWSSFSGPETTSHADSGSRESLFTKASIDLLSTCSERGGERGGVFNFTSRCRKILHTYTPLKYAIVWCPFMDTGNCDHCSFLRWPWKGPFPNQFQCKSQRGQKSTVLILLKNSFQSVWESLRVTVPPLQLLKEGLSMAHEGGKFLIKKDCNAARHLLDQIQTAEALYLLKINSGMYFTKEACTHHLHYWKGSRSGQHEKAGRLAKKAGL